MDIHPSESNNPAPAYDIQAINNAVNSSTQNTKEGPPNDEFLENCPDSLRHYSFTDFNDVICLLPCVRWFGYGNEVCPTTGRAHRQGHIIFNNAKTLSAARKTFPGVDIRKIWKNVDASVTYCMKDGDFHEEGSRPPKIDKIITRNMKNQVAHEWRIICVYKDDIRVGPILNWNTCQQMMGTWRRLCTHKVPEEYWDLVEIYITKNEKIYKKYDVVHYYGERKLIEGTY